MFRIGLKFPCNGLNRVTKCEYSKLYVTAKYYQTRAQVNKSNGGVSANGALLFKLSERSYSSGSSGSGKSRRGLGLKLAFGIVTIGTIGALAIAKDDKDVRAFLEKWIPGSDKTIKIIFQEDESYLDQLTNFFNGLKVTILGSLPGSTPQVTEVPKPVITRPAPMTVSNNNELPIIKKNIPIEKDKKKEIFEDVKPVTKILETPPKSTLDLFSPTNLAELERYSRETALKAIEAYEQAIRLTKGYNKDVVAALDNTESILDVHLWEKLKNLTEKRRDAEQRAEKQASEALNSLNRMTKLVDNSTLGGTPTSQIATKDKVKKFMDEVNDARKQYHNESGNSQHRFSEHYWKHVEDARRRFENELQILFPNISIKEKKFTINDDSFDLFVLYMYRKIDSLQKELAKIQSFHKTKLQDMLHSKSEQVGKEGLQELVSLEVSKAKQSFGDEFDKKLLAEQKKYDDEMRRQLKLQSQVHADHLKEALTVMEQEYRRKFELALGERLETENAKHNTQIATLVGRLRGLDKALKARLEEEKGACNAQALWAACQALARAIKTAPPGKSIDEAVRPLEPEIRAVRRAAPKEDPLVQATIAGIPEAATKRGVYPESALRDRFLKVEHMARKLAIVPEEGASLPIYLLSYLQNFLLIKEPTPIPKGELEDQPIDVESLDTYDILHRARYYMDRGDFKMTLRYMNLLKGAPRSVARDWINETRILLETQQAIDTLVAYAGATGLLFLGTNDSQAK